MFGLWRHRINTKSHPCTENPGKMYRVWSKAPCIEHNWKKDHWNCDLVILINSVYIYTGRIIITDEKVWILLHCFTRQDWELMKIKLNQSRRMFRQVRVLQLHYKYLYMKIKLNQSRRMFRQVRVLQLHYKYMYMKITLNQSRRMFRQVRVLQLHAL